jgi:hypothetical protein
VKEIEMDDRRPGERGGGEMRNGGQETKAVKEGERTRGQGV